MDAFSLLCRRRRPPVYAPDGKHIPPNDSESTLEGCHPLSGRIEDHWMQRKYKQIYLVASRRSSDVHYLWNYRRPGRDPPEAQRTCIAGLVDRYEF